MCRARIDLWSATPYQEGNYIPLTLDSGQIDQGFTSKSKILKRQTDKSHIRLQYTVKAFCSITHSAKKTPKPHNKTKKQTNKQIPQMVLFYQKQEMKAKRKLI